MKNKFVNIIGAVLVIAASLGYAAFRIVNLSDSYSWANLVVAVCELSALALISVEVTLLATRKDAQARKQDDTVLIESAKTVLFNETSAQAVAAGDTKIKTTQLSATGGYAAAPVDVCVFAEDSTYEQLRRCFLSLSLVKDLDQVYVVDSTLSSWREELCKEFNYHIIDSFTSIAATTESVLICRGSDILYPDVCAIARTYERDEAQYLELRSVYSDENALGENGVVEVEDKRQMIREALSSRSVATWSTGPAMVSASAVHAAGNVATSAQFFASCERKGIHGILTDEIASEEISHEQSISEVQWRAADLAYTSKAWRFSYKGNRNRAMGWTIKAWSLLSSVAVVRRLVAIAAVLAFVVVPSEYSFVTRSYLAGAIAVVAAVLLGGFLAGDSRGIFVRIREIYFDIEASAYNLYKRLIAQENRHNDKAITKKLPAVSALLIAADALLVYRVLRQTNDMYALKLSATVKNVSLFAGYLLLVSLLVGLGMVIVHQARTAMRREISRGANVDGQPLSMIDLSPGGAGCISVSPFEVDTHVKFESSLPTGDENTKFACTAIVRSCVEWNGSYRVGLAFTELNQEQKDTLEIYCSVVYPHEQSRSSFEADKVRSIKVPKLNGKAEKRFLSYAASFIALGAIIYSNISAWR